MYNLIISLTASILTGTLTWFVLPYDYRFWGIVLGVALLLGLNFFLSKRTMKKVESMMNQVTKELQNQKFDKAIRTLKASYGLGDWMFFVRQQIESQIGTIYYLTRDEDNAFEHLKKGFGKHWVAMGMLAVLYMKKGDKAMMTETFEKAVKSTPKEGLLWSLYAYCILKDGDREKALDILSRGLLKLPEDDKLKANHTAVANKEKMKMKNYGELWMQFYLEKVPPAGQKIPPYMQALAQQQGRGRRIIRR